MILFSPNNCVIFMTLPQLAVSCFLDKINVYCKLNTYYTYVNITVSEN